MALTPCSAVRHFDFERRRHVALPGWQGTVEESVVRSQGGFKAKVLCFRRLWPTGLALAGLRRLSKRVSTCADSVDKAASFEVYPVSRGQWQDPTWEELLAPCAARVQQSVELTLGPVALSEILVRRHRHSSLFYPVYPLILELYELLLH